MKQVQLAQQLGIGKSYLSMILRGKRKRSPELMRRLSSLEVHNFEPTPQCKGDALPAKLRPHQLKYYSNKGSYSQFARYYYSTVIMIIKTLTGLRQASQHPRCQNTLSTKSLD